MADSDPKPEPRPEPEWLLPDRVKKEMAGLRLRPEEAARITKLMTRYAAGEVMSAKDVKFLRDDVYELRQDLAHRTVRLYFARLDDSAVLLGLHIHYKKKNNDRDAVSKAVERLAKYRRGEWA